ncbi:MAG: acyl carrier protein [Vicinamibacteraceae bacterium]
MNMEQDGSPSAVSVDEALAWVAEMFEEPRENIQATTPRADIPAWDSLGQLVLMAQLDERFGIRLTESELPALTSVQDILDVLHRHGCLSSSSVRTSA